MSQSLGHSNMHIVFSTKKRQRWITADLEVDLHAYICGICRSLKSPVHIPIVVQKPIIELRWVYHQWHVRSYSYSFGTASYHWSI